ncbi:DUF6612 family protein [Virgibacillus doumboii]|uniref:DUF6612 family protein n=1 Tax=Virgibacillus doumboii TaxID=2697503 RepID=UPI0013E04E39|nr:DUF6612 family protein [Virgibacillus doumboii]
MKKIIAVMSLLLLMILAACGDNEASEKDAEKEAVAEQDQSAEDTTENNDKNAEQNEEKEASEDSSNNKPALANAEAIFKKSAEAMSKVTSYLIKGEFTDNSTINGQKSNATTQLTMKASLTDQLNMHIQSSTTSNTDTGGDIELYKVNDGVYLKSPDANQWYSMPASSGYAEVYNTLGADQMVEYANQTEAFKVQENSDHYVLVFSGNDEEYKSAIYGAGIAMLDGTLKEHFENMKMSGSYQIAIDKETYYITGYQFEYESSTSGEMGDIEAYHKANYTISEFNQHDKITVPQEIVDSAVSFQQ